MDWIGIISLLLAPVTGVVGWIAGKRKRDHGFLNNMQESINKLASENAKLLDEIVTVKKQNVELLIQNEVMRQKLAGLEQQNEQFKQEITDLNTKFQNVKTITRCK
jgi:regulator of replication initiation timing